MDACELTFLIVDDREKAAEELAELLRRHGSHAVIAGNAHTALIAARTLPIDCILSYAAAQRPDGLDLLRLLRTAEVKVPVVLIAGHALQNEVAAPQLGTIATLQEPIDVGELIRLATLSSVS
jgi:two-component system response regulator FixJ